MSDAIEIKPALISQPLLNSIPPFLLPRFDPVWIAHYNAYNAGRLATHQIPISLYRSNPLAYTISYGRALAPSIFRITEQTCPVPNSTIKIRIFEPAPSSPPKKRAAYINYHGGGWVFGGLEYDHEFCKRLVATLGDIVVFDVEYRLAPEYPFPVPVEDALAAFRWVQDCKVEEFNLDAGRMAVGGCSAGGQLAAVVAHTARDEGRELRFQCLGVPVCDLDHYARDGTRLDGEEGGGYESAREMGECPPLPGERMSYFVRSFLGNPRPAELYDNWKVSPIKAPNFKGLAPAFIITAELDPLRDEGKAYAEKMNAAGSRAEYVCVKGVPHIFMTLDDILEGGKFYNKVVVRAIGGALGCLGVE